MLIQHLHHKHVVKCGYVDKENRITQDKFECKKCGFTLNADHNAAINIARK